MGEERRVSVNRCNEGSPDRVTEPIVKTRPTRLRPQRRVLFASQSTQWPISAMLKADAFAKYLGAELIVLQVSKSLAGRKSLFWREPAKESVGRWVKNLTESTAHCNYILPGEVPSQNLLIRQGDFVHEVVAAVSETGADLVVMPPDRKGSGLLAMDIAHEAKVPVLVARPPRSHNIVLAATKLADGRYPVLNRARQFGGFMSAQMVFVHNVAPMKISAGHDKLDGPVVVLAGEKADRAKARLKSAAHAFPRCIAAVVKKRLSTSHAILETARECDADLIVLGVKRRSSPIERVLGGCVAARVAEHAWRSVLLAPIPASAGLELDVELQ